MRCPSATLSPQSGLSASSGRTTSGIPAVCVSSCRTVAGAGARSRRDQTVRAQVVRGRGVEVDEPLLPELHDRDRRDGLRDRGDPDDGVLGDRCAGPDVGDAGTDEGVEPATLDDAHGEAHARPAGHDLIDPRCEQRVRGLVRTLDPSLMRRVLDRSNHIATSPAPRWQEDAASDRGIRPVMGTEAVAHSLMGRVTPYGWASDRPDAHIVQRLPADLRSGHPVRSLRPRHATRPGVLMTAVLVASRPLPRPASVRIVFEVIDHYGDEVLKGYGCEVTTNDTDLTSLLLRSHQKRGPRLPHVAGSS